MPGPIVGGFTSCRRAGRRGRLGALARGRGSVRTATLDRRRALGGGAGDAPRSGFRTHLVVIRAFVRAALAPVVSLGVLRRPGAPLACPLGVHRRVCLSTPGVPLPARARFFDLGRRREIVCIVARRILALTPVLLDGCRGPPDQPAHRNVSRGGSARKAQPIPFDRGGIHAAVAVVSAGAARRGGTRSGHGHLLERGGGSLRARLLGALDGSALRCGGRLVGDGPCVLGPGGRRLIGLGPACGCTTGLGRGGDRDRCVGRIGRNTRCGPCRRRFRCGRLDGLAPRLRRDRRPLMRLTVDAHLVRLPARLTGGLCRQLCGGRDGGGRRRLPLIIAEGGHRVVIRGIRSRGSGVRDRRLDTFARRLRGGGRDARRGCR